MWGVLSNKKYLKAELKTRLKELDADRKEALAEYAHMAEDDSYRQYAYRTTNENYDRMKTQAIVGILDYYHNDQSYHLIYKDGSEVCITAEETLSGEKFPKVSDVVYAELSSADDHFDTEVGQLDWYTEERLKACDYDYAAEDDRKWQYETAIQYKYQTEWSRAYSRKHPEFVPIEI